MSCQKPRTDGSLMPAIVDGLREMTTESTSREPASHGSARICRGCWDQMHMPIPIGGPLALPFRAFGITRSKMNPDICTICERSFQYVKKQRQITVDATILFADIRGFTDLSERIEAVQLSEIVSLFQDRCAQAIWAHDGIVNKQMGDGLMAIFNFPIVRKDHAAAAIRAAQEIQRNCAAALNGLALEALPGRTLGVGVGIHSGEVQIGEFSSFRSDFTAIGGVVNQAARLESRAAAGEILVSAETAANAPDLAAGAETRMLALKGIEQPVEARVLVKH
ncbi:probable adenylate cyclase protein [Rhizobium etli CIAT 652]|nr:probable adenylate cyclase protein [Rhizobium etli CIAT 652]KKZ85834.1 adenylate cyclase [Rhizobium phaseoli Ch24-10]